MGKNIGFVSTRFSGTDGVSLESEKWSHVFKSSGHQCFWFAGELDRNPHQSFLIPQAHFLYEQNRWINEQTIGKKKRLPIVTHKIHELRDYLKDQLHRFIERFHVDLLVAQNVLTIPMHIPLGLALTETIAETGMPTISHNHDFFWERDRYCINAVGDYLKMAFPPNLDPIHHVVINSNAREQLALRTGISSIVIPNVLNFDEIPERNADSNDRFRKSLGLSHHHRLILQPTRIIQRKGIEHAVALVKALRDPRNVLIISHEAGDEGFEYADWLTGYAREHSVDLRIVNTQENSPYRKSNQSDCEYCLWDIYSFSDFITYPSLYEGFGNAFLEAVYFKKPILVNRYATFIKDIEPLGFDLVSMDGFLSQRTVESVKELLENPERRRQMVETNYAIASRNFSYPVLGRQLDILLKEIEKASTHQSCLEDPSENYDTVDRSLTDRRFSVG